MIFGKSGDVSDKILELVISGPISAKNLHEKLLSTESPVSLRAVYKAVNGLIEAGTLLKAGKLIRVDQEWLRRLKSKLSPSYQPLSVGERLSYSFISLEHLDGFWKTIVLQLEEYESDGQVFFYNPHNFWAYLPERKESEQRYYRHFAEERLHAFFVVGGSSQADMEFKRAHQNEYLQIDTRPVSGLGRTNHMSILGDFVITVRIPRSLATSLDALYDSNQSISDILQALKELSRKPMSIRFVLEHNPLKARKLKKVLSRNFYFKLPENDQ